MALHPASSKISSPAKRDCSRLSTASCNGTPASTALLIRVWSSTNRASAARTVRELRRWQERVPYFLKSTHVQTRDLAYDVVTAEAGTVLADTLASVRNTLAAGFAGALLLAVAGGYFLATRALKPARTLADAAQHIGVEHLSARLPVDNPRDEFGRLAHAFNQTRARIGMR